MRNCAKPCIALTDLTLVTLAMTVVVLFGILPQGTGVEEFSRAQHEMGNRANDWVPTNDSMPSYDELFCRWQTETMQHYAKSSPSAPTIQPVSFELFGDLDSAKTEPLAATSSAVGLSKSQHPNAHSFWHYVIAAASGLLTALVFLSWAWISPKIKLDRMPQAAEPNRSTNEASLPNKELLVLAFPENWLKVRQPWSVRCRSIAQAGLVVTALMLVFNR